MRYYSTNNRSSKASLEEAVLRGLAPDGGLYMPEEIIPLPPAFLTSLAGESFGSLAYQVAAHLAGQDVPAPELKRIVEHTIAMDAPLVETAKGMFALELFHGPTLAFKDFGARFLSGLLGYFARKQKKDIVILAATSGDTGSAVASGFYNVEGTRVIVLYPSGKVSPLQEKQFTTLGGNITAVEIDGTFDDCQRLVKAAFVDPGLSRAYTLASANSINIARLIPQTFYYFAAAAQLQADYADVVFSVPSGNFGNLTAGLMAKRLGLPVKHFVAATNINDIVPEYLATGVFRPRPSLDTISNAMDVGTPSNFARLTDLYRNDKQAFAKDVSGYAFTDEQTREALRTLLHSGYLADPHGAVAWLGANEYRQTAAGNFASVFLETAHPGKFREVVEEAAGTKIVLPPQLEKFLSAEKKSVQLSAEFPAFKNWLTNNY